MTTAKKTVKKTAKKVTKTTAKKLLRAHNARVAKDNAAFAKLPPAEKRVAIARDVLAQLSTGRLQATPGVWLQGNENNQVQACDLDSELKDLLGKMKTCEGCLIGGVFMCAVEKADKLKLRDLEEHRNMCDCSSCDDEEKPLDVSEADAFKYLKKFFSEKQLAMMECAFERGDGAASPSDIGDELFDQCQEFANDIEEPKERMRLVMENVILNKGTFRPNKKPVQMYVTPGFTG